LQPENSNKNRMKTAKRIGILATLLFAFWLGMWTQAHRFPFACWMWEPIGSGTRDKAA